MRPRVRFEHRRESLAASHRYGVVLAITVASLIFILVAPNGSWTRVIAFFTAGGTLAIGVVTSEAPRRTRHVLAISLGALVLFGGAIDLVAAPGPGRMLAATALVYAATIGVITGGLVRLVFARGVTVQAVLGALAVYLLLGLTFAALIGGIGSVIDASYFAQGGDGTLSRRAYYSFTVLTTTGFGDLTPGVGIGRLLAVFEMLIGQLYLVTVIALLVGNLGRRRGDGPRE